MGATTGIEWADATVNVWTGCTKVSPACKHCYAESDRAVAALGARVAKGLPMWGPNGFRYETANWERELRALNRKAKAFRAGYQAGGGAHYNRPRVFINSLSDTFEDWWGPVYRLEDGTPVMVAQSLDDVRAQFFRVAEECSELDILLLTKRPENVLRMCGICCNTHGIPGHIWIGATVEDQEHADKRIPDLLKVPAKVRFLSVEPLLGKVHLFPLAQAARMSKAAPVHWVIVGGESGTNARAMHPDWVRSIRDQCAAAGVPFFFKQWGEWQPGSCKDDARNRVMMNNGRVFVPHEIHANVTTDEKSRWHQLNPTMIAKVGKKNAGCALDGREWKEVPK